MNRTLLPWTTGALLLTSPLVLAQDGGTKAPVAATAAPTPAPAPAAVQQTWDYFSKGKGQGPVLGEAKLCLDVVREGPARFECTQPVPAEGVKANTQVVVWQSYLIPLGEDVQDLVIQVRQGNTVRETKDVKIKGEGWRARNWVTVRVGKAGDWTFHVMRGEKTFKTLSLKVN